MSRVALATCLTLPEPDPDQGPLSEALASRGIEPVLAAWDDAAVDWSSFALVVIRSTWNYTLVPAVFLAWAREVSTQSRVLNPVAVIEANAHKSYLIELHERGVPVVPTELRRRGEPCDVSELAADRGWETVVIKPAVSAGSRETIKVDASEFERGQAHYDRLVTREDVLLQAYQASVEDYGERSLVWLDGAFTHAIRKSPRFDDDDESVTGPHPIPDDERALADAALAPYSDLLYARVDLARDASGAPQIMELELIEPSLFLVEGGQGPLARFADAIAREAAR